MNYPKLRKIDKSTYDIILQEEARQLEGLELIPSENYTSSAVLQAVGSILIDKYSEGYPGHRYYGGNKHIDEIERLAQERAKKIFNVAYVNVQPYSGSPANTAVYFALCDPGDIIMGQHLFSGGHLTHGWKLSLSGKYFKSIQYEVLENGEIDYEEVRKLAKENKPKLIWCGASAYVKKIDFKKFADIAKEVDAYLIADISHISGLIIAGVHPSPSEYADIITTTTHKTLRGPRGAMIMITEKGLFKDPLLKEKIDKAVFPGLQGGPHNHTTAGIAVALHEANTEEFKEYGHQIVRNAKTLSEALLEKEFKLVGNGTENHLMLIDLRTSEINGWYFEYALELCNITVNKNTIPKDTNSPFYPSGIRLGTPAITSRGMKEHEMKQIAEFISMVKDIIKRDYPYVKSELKGKDSALRIKFKKQARADENLKKIKKQVTDFSMNYPIPGISY